MISNLIVIKLGGSSLQDPSVLESISDDIKALYDMGKRILLLHGGGPEINKSLEEKKITWEFIDGQRKTTDEMISVIEETLVGKVNRKLQKIFSKKQIPILGLSGSDLNILECDYLTKFNLETGKDENIFGNVGVVKSVNSDLINYLLNGTDLKQKYIPLIAPVGSDKKGNRFNINADMAATSLAVALQAQHLIFMTDQEGIWDANKKTIKEIDALGLYQLMETKVVQGGMLVKVKAVVHALRNQVKEVDIIDARKPGNLLNLIKTNIAIGTKCYQQ